MKKTTTAALVLAIGAGSLLTAAPATAAPAATPTAVVQVQESRFPSPTKGQRLRSWVCNIAPSICR